MPKPLKVYLWQSFRSEAPGPHRQTREMTAATSQAEVARRAGVNSPRKLFNLGEAGNKNDISCALSDPTAIFWCPINSHGPSKWHKAGTDEVYQSPPTPRARYHALRHLQDNGTWEGGEPPQWMRQLAARIGADSPGSYAAINAAMQEIVEELLCV